MGLPLHQQPTAIIVHNNIWKTIGSTAYQPKCRRLFVENQLPKLQRGDQRIGLVKHARHRCLERDRFARAGMLQRYLMRVEHQPRCGFAAVQRVADDWEFVLGGMAADLMGFARDRSRPHKVETCMRTDKLELRHGIRGSRAEPRTRRTRGRQQQVILHDGVGGELFRQRLVGAG